MIFNARYFLYICKFKLLQYSPLHTFIHSHLLPQWLTLNSKRSLKILILSGLIASSSVTFPRSSLSHSSIQCFNFLRPFHITHTFSPSNLTNLLLPSKLPHLLAVAINFLLSSPVFFFRYSGLIYRTCFSLHFVNLPSFLWPSYLLLWPLYTICYCSSFTS